MRSFLLAVTAITLLPQIVFAQCGGNPTSGLTTIATVGQITNSYYPGTGNPITGSSSVTVGAIDGRGSATAIATGDLVLIIQMQGANINSTNTDAYGDGVAGGNASGMLSANYYAGYYEYNTVSGVIGSTINFTYSLANNYYTQAFASAAPIRIFQVIRVPRYYDVTINAGASITSPSWNGTTGGVVVIDAANLFTLNGLVTTTALGFRGGGGKNFTGASAGNTNGTGTLVNTDFRWDSPLTTAANTTGGVKGESIAGTPAYTFSNGTTTTATSLVEGYIGGSEGRSAPANGGGGATDGSPTGSGNNQNNTGGGGGANGGSGGNGGSGWHGGSGTVSTYPYGGFGGTAIASPSLSRLVMGGGGGAGTANNSTTTNEYQSSGGCGGGIILSRAKTYAGNGSLIADGGDAPGVVGVGGVTNTDAAGGAGAGGTIVVVTNASGPTGLGSITASAKGGKGGDMTNYYDHGPGGGGGGGLIFSNGTLASTAVTGGVNGKTRTGSTGGAVTNDFGATAGAAGQLLTFGYVPTLVNNNNLASPCGVLPVSLLNFTGIAKNNGVLTQWQIATATNLHHFEIEYSTDSRSFIYAGHTDFIAGQNNYTFLHVYAGAGFVYYRLKSVDVNGGYTYSKVVSIRLNREGAALLLYPNPTTGDVTLQIKFGIKTDAVINCIDAAGKVVLQKNIGLQTGDNSIGLDTQALPAGLYVVQIKTVIGIVGSERLQVMKR